MQTERPVNLRLTSIHFPITAIVSILHRISGIALFIFLPFLLWIISYAFQSEAHFNLWKGYFSGFWGSFLLWLFFVAFAYHLVAGLRHLCMDAGWGESLKGGRWGAVVALAVWLLLVILLGVLIWVGIL